MIGIDGVIITKLDGTPKGGSIFSIAYALEIPILYIGIGEQPEDLIPFNKYEFVDGLLDVLFVHEEEVKQEEKQKTVEEKVKLVAIPKKEEILSADEESLKQFLKDERLLIIKRESDTTILVNYANTPVDTHIQYKNNKWSYSN